MSLTETTTEPVIRGRALRPRLITSGAAPLLAVFNDHRTDAVTDRVHLNCEAKAAIDIHTGQPCEIREQCLELTVPAEDCVVIRLHL